MYHLTFLKEKETRDLLHKLVVSDSKKKLPLFLLHDILFKKLILTLLEVCGAGSQLSCGHNPSLAKTYMIMCKLYNLVASYNSCPLMQ